MSLDAQVRKQLPYFLGTGGDDPNVRGVYVPLDPAYYDNGMYQFAVRYGGRFNRSSSRSMQGIHILPFKLTDVVTPTEVTELDGSVVTKNGDDRRLSQYRGRGASLQALLTFFSSGLEGCASSATDLVACDRKVRRISPNFESSVAEMTLKRSGPQLRSEIKEHTDDKEPSYVYVVIGAEYAHLAATARRDLHGQAGIAAAGNGGAAGVEDGAGSHSIAKGIVLVRLMKFKFNDLEQGPPASQVPATNPGRSDSKGGPGGSTEGSSSENSSSGAGSSTGTSTNHTLATGTFTDLGVEVDACNPMSSSAIGKRVPLDDGDFINSSLCTTSVTSAPTVLHGETRLDSELVDSSGSAIVAGDGNPRSSMIGGSPSHELDEANTAIGKRVPLDDDDYINSGIYTADETVSPSEIDHESQLDSGSAMENQLDEAKTSIGKRVPLDDDDDISSAGEEFPPSEVDHETRNMFGSPVSWIKTPIHVRGIRRKLPYFLGASIDWCGCFKPFEPDQVSMFQIGYQASFAKRWEDGFSRRRLRGVDMSSANLLNYLDDAGLEGVGTTLEAYTTTTIPYKEYVLSRYGGQYVNLKAPVMAGLGMHLEAEQMRAADLKATVREIKQVPMKHADSIDEALRQVAPRVIDDLTHINSNRRPAHVYVVVGTQRVDFAATVQSRSAVGLCASAAGTEGGVGAGIQTEVLCETKDRIALVRLLKYEVVSLLKEHANRLAVRSGSSTRLVQRRVEGHTGSKDYR